MRKFRAPVNRILILWLCALLPLNALWAKNRGHLIAEADGSSFRIIERTGVEQLAPVGSLLKPFAALYLLEHGANATQEIFCPALRKQTAKLRCWTPDGHGAMSLAKALVQSCNYYFLSQFRGRNLEAYEKWLRANFEWPEHVLIRNPVNVYGFDLEFGIEAEKLLAMYTKLLQMAAVGNTNANLITRALANVCEGTLADFCRELGKKPHYRLVLGKTGTVTEGGRNFGVVLLLVDHVPLKRRTLIICYEKGKMGSQVAMNALKLLKDKSGQKRN